MSTCQKDYPSPSQGYLRRTPHPIVTITGRGPLKGYQFRAPEDYRELGDLPLKVQVPESCGLGLKMLLSVTFSAPAYVRTLTLRGFRTYGVQATANDDCRCPAPAPARSHSLDHPRKGSHRPWRSHHRPWRRETSWHLVMGVECY